MKYTTKPDLDTGKNEVIRMLANSMYCLKDVLTMDEAVQYSGLSRSYLYKLTSTRKIPFYKPNGKAIYFKRVELEQWLTRCRVNTMQEIHCAAINHVKKGVQL